MSCGSIERSKSKKHDGDKNRDLILNRVLYYQRENERIEDINKNSQKTFSHGEYEVTFRSRIL